ncbi:MAG: peptidoglycan synthetase [Bacteroidales bacterium]|nr:peptidoglycan synthetase [Bacteroidales bacterium]
MKVHFIAIGGSAMHNLAISLCKKGYQVSGSDDEIFEPSRSRLSKHGILPEKSGWDVAKINTDIDAVILGMHAREDNPELIKARELKLRIYSYPEYLYEQTKNKIRVVIGGSHGKTTITSMIMHVLKFHNKKFDYMVGAQIDGFDTMVSLSNDTSVAVFEGDEYLSSPIDRRPKFHLYKPHIAVLSGIAWDHINVFPTFENYVDQFKIFIDKIEEKGSLFYCDLDSNLTSLVANTNNSIEKTAYGVHPFSIEKGITYVNSMDENIPLKIFGEHNLQNMNAAKLVCNKLDISDNDFYMAIAEFSGASKRLEVLAENTETKIFLDFAHSPSKLKATVNAVKNQYKGKKLFAVMELHTFSSLNSDFLSEYKDCMNEADVGVVYYNPDVIKHKKLESISMEQVRRAFNKDDLTIIISQAELLKFIKKTNLLNTSLLMMSSGNFSGIDLKSFAKDLLKS